MAAKATGSAITFTHTGLVNGESKTRQTVYPVKDGVKTTIANIRAVFNAWAYCQGLERDRAKIVITLPDGRKTNYRDLNSIKEISIAVMGSDKFHNTIDKDSTAAMDTVMDKLKEIYSVPLSFEEVGQRDLKLMPSLSKAVGIDSLKNLLDYDVPTVPVPAKATAAKPRKKPAKAVAAK